MRHDYPTTGKPIWVDLHNPTSEEIDGACQVCGLRVPTREQLDEIETSSRVKAEGDTLMLSIPITPFHIDQEPQSAPMGFVLRPDMLVTVRYDELHSVHKVGQKIQAAKELSTSSEIFMEIVESIVDYAADKLELIKADTKALSSSVFHARPRRNVAKKSAKLRETLVKLGDMDERLSEIRETLLALQRALPFVADRGKAFIGGGVEGRLKVALADIQSLNDFETHLTDKVQFLLDATLGFISNEQNDMFRVLTIASVVGIPPVFVAGVYGMNFQNQPEFHWVYGYEWGWAMIVVSMILPILWFKWRGWW